MKIDTDTLLPNTNLMVRVAVAFILLALVFGVAFGDHAATNPLLTATGPFPLLACVVWGLGFTVIFAIIYVIWLIYHAINVYKTQEQKQRMTAFQRAIDSKQVEN